MIYPSTPDNIEKAAGILRDGGIVAFPTETVYGLGANAFEGAAVEKIFAVKGRPSYNPLIVHRHSCRQLDEVIDPDCRNAVDRNLSKLARFWPGPLSVVLPKNPRIPACVTAGLGTVAVRLPSHPVARALLEACACPLAAPSANLSNRVSPTSAVHVAAELGGKIDFILDGGVCEVGLESTVISLAESLPRLLRPGAVTLEALQDCLGSIETAPDQGNAAPSSPGQLKRHYAPATKIVFRNRIDTKDYPPRVGLICFDAQSAGEDPFEYAALAVLSSRGDLNEAAAGLFAAVRKMDEAGLDLIVVDTCPDTGIGLAIMDRLKRATSPSRE